MSLLIALGATWVYLFIAMVILFGGPRAASLPRKATLLCECGHPWNAHGGFCHAYETHDHLCKCKQSREDVCWRGGVWKWNVLFVVVPLWPIAAFVAIPVYVGWFLGRRAPLPRRERLAELERRNRELEQELGIGQ
jgi:hypothetical protein